MSARVRIEPASPIAGQPLRFVLDVSTAKPCCMILVGVGEGSEVAANVTEVCSGTEPLETGASTFEATHAYAAPGAFRATISVAAGDVCRRPHPPVAESDHPTIIEACFAVGPGSAGQAGCTPRLGSR